MREGMVPAILGTAVTAAGVVVSKKNAQLGWGMTGFGLAHVILGGIDLLSD